MLSCREMAEQASDLIEGRAPWQVRASARLHLFLCQHCSRYFRQLRLTMGTLGCLHSQEPDVHQIDKVLSSLERREERGPKL